MGTNDPFADEAAKDLVVEAAGRDWREAPLGETDRALCVFAERLTHRPAEMAESDVDGLRAVGLDDVAVHDAIQVISYFNYINRIADAVHVELEPEMPPYPKSSG